MTRCACGGKLMQTRKHQRLPRVIPDGSTVIVDYTLYDCDTCGTTRLLNPTMLVPLPDEWRTEPEKLHHANRE